MTAHIFVLGFVQGVGFRRFLRSKARTLGLKGYVKNTTDGRVEAVVQGSQEKIQELVQILKKGTFFSDVKSVQVDLENSKEDFSDFQILH